MHNARSGQMHKVKFLLYQIEIIIAYKKMFFFFIRPALQYADIIWDNLPKYLSLKLENNQ